MVARIGTAFAQESTKKQIYVSLPPSMALATLWSSYANINIRD
jgi:hypothetical protein